MSNPTSPQPSATDVPKPMPFAIMRNAHEALRASIGVQERLLDANDRPGFVEEWQAFERALAVHMAMEDRSMFALLDEVGAGAVSAAGLPAEHVEDLRLARAVDAALKADAATLRSAWNAWRTDHLEHLEHEEKIMMPLTMKTAETPEGRGRVVNERLLTPSESLPDFDWYIGWVVGMLTQYGSAGQPANVAVRVFAWGLQHACTPAQWNRFRPIVERQCSPGIWDELTAHFGLDRPGAIA